jgi:hypothetical protein
MSYTCKVHTSGKRVVLIAPGTLFEKSEVCKACPSWRPVSRPQPVKQVQDLSEQSFGDNDLRELECDVAAMLGGRLVGWML